MALLQAALSALIHSRLRQSFSRVLPLMVSFIQLGLPLLVFLPRFSLRFPLSLLQAVRLFGVAVLSVLRVRKRFLPFWAGTGVLFPLLRSLLLSFTASPAARFTQSVRRLSRAFQSLSSSAVVGRLCQLI
jgi:hypothetical protein